MKELGEKVIESIKDTIGVVKGEGNKVVKELGNKIRILKTLKNMDKTGKIISSSETTWGDKGKALLDFGVELGIGGMGAALGNGSGRIIGGYIGGAIGSLGGPGGTVIGSRIGAVIGSGVGAEIAVRGYDKVKEFLKSFGKK